MILVTVGSMAEFDTLVKSIDRIAPALNDKVVIQIGKGKYVPKNCEYFKYSQDLNQYIRKANLIISHGGAGTIFEMVKCNKIIIGVENNEVNGSHQWDILKKMDEEKYLLWCKDINNIGKCIDKAKRTKFKKYYLPSCSIPNKINEFLEKCK